MPDGVPGALRVAVLLLGLAAGAAWAQSPPQAGAPDASVRELSPEERESRAVALKEVSSHLICQCGCNMVLAECNHVSCPFALPERRAILAALDAGKGHDEIVAGYVASYGRSILSMPPTGGSWLDRLAWIAPWAALAAGLAIALRLVVVFHRRSREQVRSASLTPEDVARVERELAAGGSGRGAHR